MTSSTKVLLIAVAAAAGYYLLLRKPAAPLPQIATTPPVANPRGTGVTSTVSWLGNVVGQLIGSTAWDPSAAVGDRNTPNINPAIVSNPVSPSTAVLPYSYKQATVDIPGLLGTDDLFTPSSGSSGAYADDTDAGTGAGPTAYSYDV